jgi:hypothetical protein
MDKNTLYQKINILELPQIQDEVLDYFETNPNVLDGLSGDFFVHVPLDSLPVAKSFLLPRAQLEVNEVSVYFIPPNHKTRIHIDGLRKDNGKVPNDMLISHQYVLIIPIENSTDSINYWYSNDSVPDDMENIHYYERAQFPYKFFVSFVKDECEPEPIGSIVMDQPAFIKSNIYHRVDNSNNSKTRKVLVIRFREREYYDTLDSVFNYKDLLND